MRVDRCCGGIYPVLDIARRCDGYSSRRQARYGGTLSLINHTVLCIMSAYMQCICSGCVRARQCLQRPVQGNEISLGGETIDSSSATRRD